MFRRTTQVGLCLAVLLTCLGLPSARPVAAQGGGKLVLAFYYMWYLPDMFATRQMSDHPIIAYNSSLPEVMDGQVKQAKSAGIDAFIASWSGSGTDTDKNFGTLLNVAAKEGFHATVYFEVDSVMQHGDVTKQLQGLLARYSGHPAFLRWGGKPVVFFWRPDAVGKAAAWQKVRAVVDPNGSQIWSADTVDPSYYDAFDTIHFFSAGQWDASTNVANVDSQWRGIVDNYNKSHGTQRLWTAGVTPGWDESHIVPARNPVKVIPRGDGAQYDASWRGAIASNPDWITITSWNEWFEGTQIEPSASYGPKYLDMTRQYAGRWKNGSSPCDGGTYFKETGQSICKPMESYWQKYGGLPQFGFPISPPVSEKSATDGKTYTVQYFERARFELHPEAPQPYEVELGLLGRQFHPPDPRARQLNDGKSTYFKETGHNVPKAFYSYWQSHGGLFVNGYPISEPLQERAADGKTYTVQYFERARFELHPENAPPYNVLLGLLGRQAFH